MRLIEYIVDEYLCYKDKEEIFRIAKENGCNPEKEFESFRMFIHARSDVYRILRKLAKDEGNNQATSIFTALLNGVMIVTSSKNVDHCWEALISIQKTCEKVIQEDGTPSDQFAIMAATSLNIPQDTNLSEEDSEE